MGICILGFGDCSNKQETIIKTNIRSQAITDIEKDFTNIFSNIYDVTSTNNCDIYTNQETTADDLTIINSHDIIIENVIKSDMMCVLQTASESKIQSDITSSLEAAIEKKLGSDIWNKLDQDATSQMGSIGNDQSSETTTTKVNISTSKVKNNIRNEIVNKISSKTIQTVKNTIIQKHNYKNGILIESSSNIKIRNSAEAFLQSQIISNTINNAIGKVVDTQKATEILEIQDKVKNESKQISKANGFAEILDSFGNIFSFGGILPFIIIIGVFIAIFAFNFKSFLPLPQQQYMLQNIAPQQSY